MSSVLNRYLDKVIKDNRTIDSRGVMQVNRMIEMNMDEVFIDLTVRMGNKAQSSFERAAREKMVRYVSPEAGDHLRKLVEKEMEKYPGMSDFMPERISPTVESGISTEDLWARSNRWVLLGDPGAGKTTLLKHFALQSALDCKRGTGYLPILLPLRLFAAEWAQQPKWTVQNAVLNYLADKGLSEMGFEQDHEHKALLNHIEQALNAGLALLLFDGLDEQRDAASQRKSVAAIESLSSRHSYNRILVSSRIIGYDAAPLGAGFNTATLEAFSDEQMEAFFRKWILAVEKQEDITVDELTIKRAQEKADELIEQIKNNAGIRALTTNPLLCAIIGLIRRQGATLPQLRAELYKLCIDTFIFNWELQKRRRPDQDNSLDKDQTQAVLEELALHFHENCPENREPQQAISEVIKNFLVTQQGMQVEAAASKAGQLLSLIRDVSGLLIDRGNNEFGFFHLTFQEYLAARAITRRKRDIERYLRQHLFEPRWREVIRLAAAHQGMKDEETGSEFIETILRCKHPREAQMHYAFRIAFLCLKEARVLLETSDSMLREWIRIYLAQTEMQDLLLRLIAQPGAEIRHRDDTLQPLLDAIRDDKSTVRSAVASALVHFKYPSVLPALLGALMDEDWLVRIHAIGGLLHFNSPTVISALQEALKDEDDLVRWSSVQTLAQINTPVVLPALLSALHDEYDLVRSGVADALTKMKDPAVLPALLDALKDDDIDVRISATRALAQLKDPAISPALLGRLKDESPLVRIAAAVALAQFQDSAALQVLLSAIKDEVNYVRYSASEALAQFKDPAALQALLDAIKDEDSDVRRATVRALAQFQDPAALQALLGALKDEDSDVRRAVVRALAQFQDPAALQALRSAIKDKSSHVRIDAAEELAQFQDPAALQALLSAIKDKSGLVRSTAAAAFAKYKSPAALQALLDAIKDEDNFVRMRTAWALAQFKDPAVLPALLGALNDKDDFVQKGAANSIEQIDLGAALCPD